MAFDYVSFGEIIFVRPVSACQYELCVLYMYVSGWHNKLHFCYLLVSCLVATHSSEQNTLTFHPMLAHSPIYMSAHCLLCSTQWNIMAVASPLYLYVVEVEGVM